MTENRISTRLRRTRLSKCEQRIIGRLAEEEIAEIKHTHDRELNQSLNLMADVVEEATLANQMKSQFLASMSHELRTPLHAIIGFLDVVLLGVGFETEAICDPKARECLQHAITSAKGLEAIISDVLTLSRIEAGRMELVLTDINISGLAESVYQEHVILARQRGIELSCVVDKAMPEIIRSDQRMLRSIIVNLVGNAIKFTDDGSVEMAFLLHGDGWKIRVTDTGIGIDLNRVRELFEPFVQLEGGGERRYGGTGLGASLVKRMAAMLNGQVEVESELGKGSIFTVSFPGR